MQGNGQVFINRISGETLIYPKDETDDEVWIQEHLIDQARHKQGEESVFYAKGDAVKLEQFLKQ